MLCGALSWLSSTISNGVSAGALTSVGENVRSFAVTTMAFGSTEPAGAAVPAEDPEHAARTAARAPSPRMSVSRFMWMVAPFRCWCADLGGGAGLTAAARDERDERAQLAADDRDRVAVHAHE